MNNLAQSEQDERADQVHRLVAGDKARYLSAAYLSGPARIATVQRTLKACDEALLQVISRWKRLLRADYPIVDNRNISALFNALILVRGCEDRDLDRPSGYTRVLLQTLQDTEGTVVDLPAVLQKALARSGISTPLREFVADDALRPFVELDRATALNLLSDLYAPRDAAYNFNFSLMSKHALSRIYEKYVALLRDRLDEPDTGRQLSFIAATPVEEPPVRTGAVYTPQFIAGFFARFIRKNTTPRRFRSLKTIDPACGSGIFLRTLLELQCDPLAPGITQATIETAFAQAEGIDKDPNACEATRLSLALLHLIATNRLPRATDLRIFNRDAIAAALRSEVQRASFSVVLANPPYITHQSVI